MDFNEFVDLIVEGIKEKSSEEVDISVRDIDKNNGVKLKGVTIKRHGNNVAPTIYMENYYEEYKKGQDIADIVDKILAVYQDSVLDDDFDISYYQDFEKIKGKLFCKVINTKKNAEMLNEVPYEKFCDLSLVVYCRIDELRVDKASILVKNGHLDMWKVSEEEVIEIAKANTRNNIGIEIVPIVEAISRNVNLNDEHEKLFEECSKDCPMYVVTSTDYIFGAVFMCFEEHLKSLAERLGEDYYILPSSIHEIIILRASSEYSLDDLGTMVKEVNLSVLDATEILSEHAYLYSREQEVLIF